MLFLGLSLQCIPYTVIAKYAPHVLPDSYFCSNCWLAVAVAAGCFPCLLVLASSSGTADVGLQCILDIASVMHNA